MVFSVVKLLLVWVEIYLGILFYYLVLVFGEVWM